MLDRASALPVRIDALQELLARVAVEVDLPAPRLEPLGGLAADDARLPSVRFAPLDWETLWRNLFANAMAAGRSRVPKPVRLGLSAETRRDGGDRGSRASLLVLADDLPGSLSAEELRSRPAERGWGVIAEILRRNDAAFDVDASARARFHEGHRARSAGDRRRSREGEGPARRRGRHGIRRGLPPSRRRGPARDRPSSSSAPATRTRRGASSGSAESTASSSTSCSTGRRPRSSAAIPPAARSISRASRASIWRPSSRTFCPGAVAS